LVGLAKANVQLGVEFNSGRAKIKSTESQSEEKIKFRYISPFLGVMHPITQSLFIGLRAERNMEISVNQSYSSLAMLCSIKI